MNEQNTTTVPAIVIDFDGDVGTFKAHPTANQYLLSQYLDDLTQPGFASLKAVTVLILDQVLDEDREVLQAYLLQHGRHDDFATTLYNALSACWSGETNLPFEPSSDSFAPTEQADSSSTDDSPSPDMKEWPGLPL